MRKEILFAIIAGSLLGLVIAFGIWRANVALKPKEQPQTSGETTETPSLELTLAKPENEEVVLETPTVISGVTKAGSIVVISAEEKDYLTETDEKGAFETEVDLIGGINEIKVTAFDQEENQSTKTILVVYSSEFAKSVETENNEEETSNEEATNEAETVRQIVKDKLAAATNKPKAYLGTITDLAASTIQLKSNSGEIKQVSADDENTDFIKVAKTTTTVEYKDLAIGDFIVAMGFTPSGEPGTNGNSVLQAKRILITTAFEPSKRTAVFGKVTNIEKDTISLKQADGTQVKLEFGKKWVGPEIDEIKEGDKLVAVGKESEGIIEVRTIKIITPETPAPSPASPTGGPASPKSSPSPTP